MNLGSSAYHAHQASSSASDPGEATPRQDVNGGATAYFRGRGVSRAQAECDTGHPLSTFADPTFPDVPLEVLHQEYLGHLRGRVPRVSPDTIKKYDDTLTRFVASLVRRGEPPVLSAVTPANVRRWLADQRAAGLSEHTIVNRLAALKAFTGKYLYREVEITTVDLLLRVQKLTPPDKPRQGLNEEEREAVLSCFNDPTFYDTRDRAMIAVTMATGLRFREMLELPLSSFDRLHGELVVTGKGGKVRTARLSQRALKYVRRYLVERPKVDIDRLWLTQFGDPLTYEGGHAIIRRVRKKSGVTRLTWHLMRHGFAQHALAAGAHPGIVQEMLGHSSPMMTRKYLGQVRQQEAARLMPQYAPI